MTSLDTGDGSMRDSFCLDDTQQQQYSKRPRKLSSWESSLTSEERPGLVDLFGSHHHADAGRNQAAHSSRRHHASSDHQQQQHSFLRGNFFTLRLEHREGGTMARHPGEERFLLFRSDRAGSIAKVIFSSDDADTTAKVHVLDVKSDYRGKDLGGFLFTQAMAALMERYESGIACSLDAEEDVQRHDRLLQFYQHLGCQIKPNVKIQYINNNDGETYRKIPMKIDVNSSSTHEPSINRMLGVQFLPIQLLEAAGHRAGIDTLRFLGQESIRRLDWLLIDDGSGRFQFRTTMGHYLRADEFGRCSAVDAQDQLCFYLLYRVSDEGLDENDSESEEVRRKELWMLRSSHGHFLTIDGQSLTCSKDPSFWQADDHALSLTCTYDTPPRRQHYRQYWAKQTVSYVQTMRERYLSFALKKMTLCQALDLVAKVPCHPYSVQRKGPSTKTLCFRAAEVARNAGQPDWVQLMFLIHELGVVVNRIDSRTAIESEDGYDWSRASRSHVIGCGAPDRASFAEFRYLNADARDDVGPQGIYDPHCGLENVMLAWTGPEYLFHMLKHNNALVPNEGLYMLRYFTLGDWHTHNEYSHLANEDDEDLKSFVAEFDTLRRVARKECVEDIPNEKYDKLWDDHYQQIADKYGLSGILKW